MCAILLYSVTFTHIGRREGREMNKKNRKCCLYGGLSRRYKRYETNIVEQQR